jgi:hypothetical protein
MLGYHTSVTVKKHAHCLLSTPYTRALIWCSGLHQHKNAFYIKIIFVNFIIFVIFVISGIEVAYRSKEEGKLYKNYIYNFYIKGVIDIIYICAYVWQENEKNDFFDFFDFSHVPLHNTDCIADLLKTALHKRAKMCKNSFSERKSDFSCNTLRFSVLRGT